MSPHPSRRASIIALASLPFLPRARAQEAAWPQRPITIMVPSAAGGAADFTARVWGHYLERAVPGAQVVIDNRAGAGGILGTVAAKNSPADGYTYLISTNSTHAANASLYAKPGYDPQKDFEPVGLFGKFGSVLMVPAASETRTLPQLIAFAKAHPGKLSFGYYSSSSQVPAELLKARAGISCVGVAYKNITQIITDLIGGQIDFAFLDMLSAAPAVGNARLLAIGVSSPVREPSLPNVPAVAEVLRGYEVQGWIGLHAPAGTPKAIVDRVGALMLRAVADSEVKKSLEGRGMVVGGLPVAQMRGFINEEIARWVNWVRLAGIKPE